MADAPTNPEIKQVRPQSTADLLAMLQGLPGPFAAILVLYYLLQHDVQGIQARIETLSEQVGETKIEIVKLGSEVDNLGRRLDRIEAQPPAPPPTTPARR